jgi:steroid delta-isomerase-like uncharacterized protein
MHPSAQREIVERWFADLFTRGDLAVIDELVAEDFVAHGPGGSPGSRGRDALRDWLGWYLSAFTDRGWTILDVITEGEKVVVHYAGQTTYRGGFFDIPASGQRVPEPGIIIFRIAEGQVREMWSELSDLQLVMALGAFPCKGT